MGQQADGSIVISTLGDLVDYGYTLSPFCWKCNWQLKVDVHHLAEMFGRETNYVRTKFPLKCARCDSRNIGYIVGAPDKVHSVETS